MNVPADLPSSWDNKGVGAESDAVRIGITDYAQDNLGDVVFVQPLEVGAHVDAGASFSEVESTKSVSDIYAPISGTVVEVNTDLENAPDLVNRDPYGDGWICTIRPDEPAQVEGLLDAAGYLALIS